MAPDGIISPRVANFIKITEPIMNLVFIASFFGYISILIGIGYIVSRRQKTSADFMLGSRSVNYWVTAIATHATDMSSWLFMAFPGVIYAQGIFGCWSAIGILFFMLITWQFVAQKLREATAKYKALTLSSYLEKHFNDKSGAIRILSAAFALFFFALYISAGIVALGRALEATFGFSYHTGIMLGTITVALYAILGGFIAIAWNDFLQGMFVLCVIVFFPIYALYLIGGFPIIIKATTLKNITLSLFPDFSLATIGSLLSAALGWGLGYFGQPHILVNFMGIDNPKDTYKAKYIGLSWQVITLSAATLIGLIGIAFFKTPLINDELVFISMVKVIFSPFIAGLILCAILAAAISTMDSQILVSASMLTQDIYKKIFNKKASPKQLLTLSRLAAVAIVFISLALAFNNKESIFSLIGYAWGGLGSTFGPVVLLSLYSKKITRNGALAGIVVGGVTAALWKYTGLPPEKYAIIPGFALSFFSTVMVSRLTRRFNVS
jgi:sodium/proline symporter